MIPSFPNFTAIDLAHRGEMDAYFAQHPPLASEYTFTNLFAWREVNHYQIARYGGGFLIRKGEGAALSFLQPLVPDEATAAVETCLEYLATHGGRPVLERLGEDFLTLPSFDATRFILDEDRENFDYVYSMREMIELKGEKFHDKKNLLNQFHRKFPDATYSPLTPAHIDTCLQFAHDWCLERQCEQSESLTKENCAVVQMLTHFTELNAVGGVLESKGQMVAFTLGEALNPETFVIHVEKGKSGMIGVYQAINNHFLHHDGQAYAYVNREQDLGVPGLRKAKESYNPVRYIKKYCLTPRA